MFNYHHDSVRRTPHHPHFPAEEAEVESRLTRAVLESSPMLPCRWPPCWSELGWALPACVVWRCPSGEASVGWVQCWRTGRPGGHSGVSPCACCGGTGPGQPAQRLQTLLGRGRARCCRGTNGTSTELLLYSKHSAYLMQVVLPQLLTAACRDWETGSGSSWAWLLMSRRGGEGQVHDTFPRKEGGQGEGGTGVTGHWV